MTTHCGTDTDSLGIERFDPGGLSARSIWLITTRPGQTTPHFTIPTLSDSAISATTNERRKNNAKRQRHRKRTQGARQTNTQTS